MSGDGLALRKHARDFVYDLGMNGDELLAALVNGNRTYLHYTDEPGMASMLADGVIRTDQKGYVYFTQEPFTQAQAHTNLFIGSSTHAGRGSHILCLRLDNGLPLEDCGFYEVRSRQSVRIDQHQLV
jgi:hypothetical protein